MEAIMGKFWQEVFFFFLFFFLSSRQLKKIFLRKKMYSVARVTVVSKLLQQKPDITYQTTELLIWLVFLNNYLKEMLSPYLVIENRRKMKKRKIKRVDLCKKCFCLAKYLLGIKVPSCDGYICMQELFSQIQNIRRMLCYPVFNFSSQISNPACAFSE